MRKIAAALSLALLALAAGSASAYRPIPIKPNLIKPLPIRPLDLAPKPFVPVVAGASAIVNNGMPAPSGDFSDHAVLQSFEFGFNNGDHKLREIAALQYNGQPSFTFADADSNDGFQARAEWLISPSVTPGSVAAMCRGECDIDIPAGPADSTLVLRGFAFERAPNTDANVHIIGLTLNSAQHKIRAELFDDQGPDYTQAATDVATHAFFGGVPLGEFMGGGQSLVDVYQQLQTNGGAIIRGHYRAYAVQVQYAWVPNSLIRGNGSVSSSSRVIESGRRPSGKHALTGFRFAYGNTDHYLLGLGVELANSGPGGYADYQAATGHAVFAPMPASEVVVFQDANRDDPITWDVNYVEVK